MFDAIFDSLLFNVFVFLSGIASIVSLLLGLKKYPSSVLVAHIILVAALSAFSSYSYFSYRAIQDTERALSRRKEAARQEAASILAGLSTGADYYQPGSGRGIALAGLAFLEQYRDLYPETFKLAQVTVRTEIEVAQKVANTSEERHRMQTAGVAMLHIL